MINQFPATRTMKSLHFERMIHATFSVGPKLQARIIASPLGEDLMDTPTHMWEQLTEVQNLKSLIARRIFAPESLRAIDYSKFLIEKAA